MKWIILITLVLFDLNNAKFSPKTNGKDQSASFEHFSEE